MVVKPIVVVVVISTNTVPSVNTNHIGAFGQSLNYLIHIVVNLPELHSMATQVTRIDPTFRRVITILILETRSLDDTSHVNRIVIACRSPVIRQSQNSTHTVNLLDVLINLLVIDGVILNTIHDSSIQSVSLFDSLLVHRSINSHKETLISLYQFLEQSNRLNDFSIQIECSIQSSKHSSTVISGDSSLCISLHLRSALEDVLTHRLRQVNLSKSLFKDRLNQISICRIVIGQLEVIEDTPPILVAIHLHTDAEGIALFCNQTIGNGLIHTPAEALSCATH